MKKILVIDDENDLLFILEQVLIANGYEVRTAKDGEEGMAVYKQFSPDLILLDRIMPNKNGTELAKEIRLLDKQTPILIVSGMTSEDDVLLGFSTGVNDYIRKPFSIKELLARVNAFLSSSEKKEDRRTFNFGGFTLDSVSQVLSFEGRKTQLTNMEFSLLKILVENVNSSVSINSILNALWDDGDMYYNSNLHVYISRLRSILECNPRVKIMNMRSVGYKLLVVESGEVA